MCVRKWVAIIEACDKCGQEGDVLDPPRPSP